MTSPDTLDEVQALLDNKSLAKQAFEWVESAIARVAEGIEPQTVLFPALPSGVWVSQLSICQDYSCRCGWNVRISGRDPVRSARLRALFERGEDAYFGTFKVLESRENGSAWTFRVAGNEDIGLDAIIRLVL